MEINLKIKIDKRKEKSTNLILNELQRLMFTCNNKREKELFKEIVNIGDKSNIQLL